MADIVTHDTQPGKFDEPDDIRSHEQAGVEGNYDVYRSPSGHTVLFDDSEGAESVTVQHRSGSMVQFRPDGTIHFRSNKDKIEVVLGNQKMKITGAYDIMVDGASTMLVEGNYDMTVNGDVNMAVKGNMKTIVGQNHETIVNGQQTTVVKEDMNIEVAGNKEELVDGTSQISADGGISLSSMSSSIAIVAEDNIGISSGGQIHQQSSGKTFIDGSEIHFNL